MSQPPEPVASSPTQGPTQDPTSTDPFATKYAEIFAPALSDYKKQTGQSLNIHPFASKPDNFESPDTVLDALRDKVQALDARDANKLLMTWLGSYIKLLFAVSAKLREGTRAPSPLEKPICTAIVILLEVTPTAYQVDESYSSLVELFERLQFYFQRIDISTEISYTMEIKAQILKFMAEALSTLAGFTKTMKQKQITKTLNALARKKKEVKKIPRRMNTLTDELEETLFSVSKSQEVVHHDSSSALVTPIGEPIHDAGENLGPIQEDDPHADRGQAVTRDPTTLAPPEPGPGRKGGGSKGGSAASLPLIEPDKLRDWLTPPDYLADHDTAHKAQLSGTGKWFFKDNAFQSWKKNACSFLISGKPGSGKTVLCSSIIEEVQRPRDKSNRIAYYYFDPKDSAKCDLWALLVSLVTQLGGGDSPNPYLGAISELHANCHNGSEQPSEAELVGLLKSFPGLQPQSSIYIFIDGVDKCSKTGTESALEKVVDFLQKLIRSRHSNLHICITSSTEKDMQRYINKLAPSTRDRRVNLDEQDGQKADIKRYISDFVQNDKDMQKWPAEGKKNFVKKLSEEGGENFRWVSRRLNTLRGSPNIPEEVGTPLDETFEQALRDIPDEKYQDAFCLFKCLVVALRPIELKELVDIFSTALDSNAVPNDEAVLSACPALVVIEEKDSKQIVQFSHSPKLVENFLTSKRLETSNLQSISGTGISRYHFSLEDANATLSRACVNVLLRFDDSANRKVLESSPLALYAAQHWVDHTQFPNVASKSQDVMRRLLDPNESHLEAWIWMHDVDKDQSRAMDDLATMPPSRDKRKATPLYYAALCGFSELVTHLAITHEKDLNDARGYHGTPLHAASYKGHLDTMRALIGLKADLDLAIGNKTPLHAAYFGRKPKTMELLIDEGANVNGTGVLDKDATGASGKDKKGASGNTVLHYASLDGRKDVVDLLLARNAKINAQNSNGWTPLHRAALRGHVEVAKSLLKEVARRLKENEDEPGHWQLHQDDVLNSKSRNNNTPLHVAAIAGKLKVVNLLLDEKAKTDIYGEHGWTPVQAAEANRHEGIVRLLNSSDLRRFVSNLPSALRQLKPQFSGPHVPFS